MQMAKIWLEMVVKQPFMSRKLDAPPSSRWPRSPGCRKSKKFLEIIWLERSTVLFEFGVEPEWEYSTEKKVHFKIGSLLFRIGP